MIEFGAPGSAEDLAALGRIAGEAFGFSSEYWPSYAERIGPESFRVARRAGRVVAGLAIYRIGAWFGGRCVPLSGIACVCVPPEERGQGTAHSLMCATLRECEEPLSGLYPATVSLYRKSGYEVAGTRTRYAIDLRQLGRLDRSLAVRRVDGEVRNALEPLYRRWASRRNGPLDRDRALWERLLDAPSGGTLGAWTAGPAEKPEGYAVMATSTVAGERKLFARDLVALTPRAAPRLLALLGDHRSVISEALWVGAPTDPLLSVLSEPAWKVEEQKVWMLRVARVRQALVARGWPADGEVHFDLRDDVFPENTGRIVLRVAGGMAEVAEGGRGELRLDVRALGPLYSGLWTARQLRDLGWLDGTDEGVLTADRLFAGPAPWCPDYY